MNIARKLGKPITGTYHVHPENIVYNCLGFAGGNLVCQILYRYWCRVFYDNYAYLQCPTDNVRERLERHHVKANRWKCVTHYPQLSREHVLEYAVSDLMTMIDTTYQVTEQCAVAGLSDGARIAANIANTRPDRIHTVGLFSPVIYKKQLPKNTGQSYIIYVGKNDFFKPNGKRFHRRMTKAGYPHQYIETQGGHDWPVWRKCLSDFLTHL